MGLCIVITHQYPLNAPGGGTRSCLKIAEHLEKMGVEVILLPLSATVPQEFESKSIKVIPVLPNRIHYLLSSLAMAKTVKKVIQNRQVDAVLSWEYEAAFLPQLLKSQKVVFGMIMARPSYEEWISRKTGGIIKYLTDEWFRWRPVKNADVVFVSSKFTRDEVVNLLQVKTERIKITHRGIDDIFSQIQRSYPDQVSNFIFYGSFAPIKGVFDAIAALGKVASQGYKNWTLKLAGWGDEEAVKKAIREHGIEEQVLILGQLTPPELAQEIEWAQVAILPSRAESFGRSIAEAQAAGLAVISSDAGSIPEIIENGVTGWVVPTQRVDLLADAIVEAIENPDKVFQMGIMGRDRVTQKFSWERTAMAILEGIQQAQKNQNYII